MTVEEVKRIVAHIDRIKGDDEVAHGMEDDLFEKVLEFIAAGNFGLATELAEEAIKSSKLEFERWCA